ncbi:MAG: flagellar hook-basal body protein [Clostridium sp.]|nr:flagellar hook-basal body protein [Clostridium sp.]
MRVTNTATNRNFTASVNDVHSRLNKSMNKVSSGREYETAADNPLAYYEGQKIDSQYQDALSKTTLLTDIKNRLYQQELGARSIQEVMSGSSGAKVMIEKALNVTSGGKHDIATIRDSLFQKQQSIINDLTSQYQNFYIYGGNDTSTAPFALSADGKTLTFRHQFPGETTVKEISMTLEKQADGSYDYRIPDDAWDDLKRAMSEQGRVDIGYGSINDKATLLDTYTGGLNMLTGLTSDAVRNMTGDEFKAAFQEAVSDSPIGLIGEAALAMDDYVNASDADLQTAKDTMHDVLGSTLDDMTKSIQTLGTVYSDLGNKYKVLETTETRLNTIQDALQEQYTDKLGADPYAAIMEMYNNNYSYNAALKVGANLMGASLFDFMK